MVVVLRTVQLARDVDDAAAGGFCWANALVTVPAWTAATIRMKVRIFS